jgi:hypothetical protein
MVVPSTRSVKEAHPMNLATDLGNQLWRRTSAATRRLGKRSARPVTLPVIAGAVGALAGPLVALLSHRRALDVQKRLALRSSAIGAVAVGALALGAVSIGALAIARLTVRSMRIARLRIDELDLRRTTGTSTWIPAGHA